MKKQLPKVVYVSWEDDINPYLSAEQSIDSHALRGEKRIVGLYQLVELHEVELEVKSAVKAKKVNYKD